MQDVPLPIAVVLYSSKREQFLYLPPNCLFLPCTPLIAWLYLTHVFTYAIYIPLRVTNLILPLHIVIA